MSSLALGASLLFVASVAAAGDVVITESARARFTAGVNLLKDPDGPRYEEAYREFKAAYSESPSYKILLNLGVCAMKLERDEEAIEAFERYLKETPALTSQDAAQIKGDLLTLKTGLVRVVLESNPPGATIVDMRIPVSGTPVTNTHGPLKEPMRVGIRQGRHVMTAKLPGRPDVVWEVETSGSELPRHVFEFAKDEDKPAVAAAPAPVPSSAPTVTTRPVTTPTWIALAVTGALGAGAVVTGSLALAKHGEYEKLNGEDPAEAAKVRDSGQTLNVVTDVLIGSTVAAAGVTALLYFTRPTVEGSAPSRGVGSAGSFLLRPTAGPAGAGLWLNGQF